jgi:Leucine-rich repeat (LRR) protein
MSTVKDLCRFVLAANYQQARQNAGISFDNRSVAVWHQLTAILRWFTQLKSLDLSGSRISDRCYRNLKNLTNLEELDVTDTRLSKPTVERLRRALPDCVIQH